MPTGSTFTPGALPGRFTGLGRLPEGEIHGAFFTIIHINAGAGLHIFNFSPRKLTVAGITIDPEVNITFHWVSKPFIDQALDHGEYLVHLARGAWVDRGRQNVEVFEMLLKFMDVHFAQGERIHVLFFGLDNDLVVHVCEVHHMAYIIAAIGEVTANDIKDQR
ncbi:hypothetical protein SDC9_96802 [bioreactor metagenome]|uniref:Uncharacterized protein n=1 Tax=bioreactor metagenome TaxID=1076179 RepID=A0A645ABL1_9ZZZZ